MGKDSKPKESGKEKGKQEASGSDENASKGKGKGAKSADGLGTCTYVKARQILCEKQGKINEAYKKLQDGWLENGDKVPPAEFSKFIVGQRILFWLEYHKHEYFHSELLQGLVQNSWKEEIEIYSFRINYPIYC
ncbi:uncharacterized protein LOC110268410 [Arachis ipaensis]|uniref:uncharacterized protein LOC110268410 n=1 Tax=Arachis ipaensis TaxID=130454 RepID=UPI000A2B0C75|nr:uncharacterized protein LOC110268410 [Arachis ipaensis]XP_025685007.1 uncharacterized protein LOC112785792 [Arachis hypogaea]